MTEHDLGKEMDEYKRKTALFPHPKMISKHKKRQKKTKENSQKER